MWPPDRKLAEKALGDKALGFRYAWRDFTMSQVLPPDFRDRPRLQRIWANVLVLFRRKAIKAECCESFRKEGKSACKGCATIYHPESAYWLYRWLARIGKHAPPKPKKDLG